MDELEELQRQLESVQNEVEVHKLSERNIVELMDKLVQREQLELLHSMNGKEYLTSEHLGAEILAELKKAGGRLSVIELPKLLDVASEHINKQLDLLIRKDKRRLFLINDALFTNVYLDSIATEIANTLRECCELSFSELSTMYDLPVDFLRVKLAEWIDGEKLRGKTHGAMVYNEAHISREKARVRGLLRATTRPVTVGVAAGELHMEESLLVTLLEEMVAAGEVQGKLQSGLYVPGCFEKSQQNVITSFYENNLYVQYSLLSQLMIQKPRDYLDALALSGNHLATVYIDENLVVQVDSHIGNAISSDIHVDLYAHLPQDFNEEDLRRFLELCPSYSKVVAFGHYVASPKYLENCVTSLKEVALKYAAQLEEAKKQGGAKKAESAAGKKKKKGKHEDDSDNEEDRKIDLGLDSDVLIEELKKSPKLKRDGTVDDDGLLAALAEQLYPELRQLYEDAYKIHYKSKQSPPKVTLQQLEGDVQKEFDKLQLAVRSLDLVDKILEKGATAEEKKKVQTMLVSHVSKKHGAAVFNYCVVQQLISSGFDISDAIKGKQIAALPATEREVLLKQIPKTILALYSSLNKLISERDVRTFLKTVLENKTSMAISIKMIDKKSEKSTKQELIKTHMAVIASENDDLRLVVYNGLCLAWIENGVMISLPNEIWAMEMMVQVLKLLGKVDSGLLDMVELVKLHSQYIKIERDERTPEQVTYLKSFDLEKAEHIQAVRLLWKISS